MNANTRTHEKKKRKEGEMELITVDAKRAHDWGKTQHCIVLIILVSCLSGGLDSLFVLWSCYFDLVGRKWWLGTKKNNQECGD